MRKLMAIFIGLHDLSSLHRYIWWLYNWSLTHLESPAYFCFDSARRRHIFSLWQFQACRVTCNEWFATRWNAFCIVIKFVWSGRSRWEHPRWPCCQFVSSAWLERWLNASALNAERGISKRTPLASHLPSANISMVFIHPALTHPYTIPTEIYLSIPFFLTRNEMRSLKISGSSYKSF